MRKLFLFAAAFIIQQIAGAQSITVSFKELDNGFSTNTYIVRCTEFGSLNIGSSGYLFDSVMVNKKSGKFQIPANMETGFYRLQNIPLGRPPYSFLSKINSSIHIFIDHSDHKKIKLSLKSNSNYSNAGRWELDADNKELLVRQEQIKSRRDLLLKNMTNLSSYSKEQFFKDYLTYLCELFRKSFSDIARVYLAQQIHEAKEIMPEEKFSALVKVDYLNDYSSSFLNGSYYRRFKDYVLEKYTVDIEAIKKIPLLNKSLVLKEFEIDNQLTVADMWASWCKPCRQENKTTLQKLAIMAKQSNFRLVSISFDTDADKWKRALEEDKMSWEQYSDTAGVFGEFGKISFAATLGLPRLLVIRNGKVIAQNLRGSFLIDFISAELRK